MITIEEFARLQLKVAKVVEARVHPNADRLLLLKVHTGSEDNLEPATIRGVVSQGMLLAAHDGEALAVVAPERPVAPGAVVK